MAKRRQPSSIDRLPEPVQEKIAELRRQGRTIDEIMEALAPLDIEMPSRSAVGRHVKTLAEIGEQMRRSQNMAKFIVGEFGEDNDDRLGRANLHVPQGAILEILTEERVGEDGERVQLSAEEAKTLSISIQRLVSAQSMDAARQLRMRAEFAKTAAAAAEKAMKSKGMSADTIDFIRSAVLGTAE